MLKSYIKNSVRFVCNCVRLCADAGVDGVHANTHKCTQTARKISVNPFSTKELSFCVRACSGGKHI
jgi:hypothetical protein